MKKITFTIITFFVVFGAIAQTNNIFILKEYGHDSWDTLVPSNGILGRMDINDDGNYDFWYCAIITVEYMSTPKLYAREGACSLVKANEWPEAYNCYVNADTPLNDTSLKWITSAGAGPTLLPEKIPNHYHRYDTMTYKSGIREEVEGDYYYGWVEVYAVNTYDTVFFHVARTCYCTIPNYPLRWGQTSLTIVNENGENPSLFVYPNPTSGLVSVMGDNIRQIDIFNTLGQHVITLLADGDRTTINLNKQPAGLYFVSVSDQEGRKCVKKVVKI